MDELGLVFDNRRSCPFLTRKVGALAVIGCFCLLTIAPVVHAQDAADVPLAGTPLALTPQELVPLDPVVLSIMDTQRDDWVREFVVWQKWAQRWLNRRQWGQWSVLDRRPMPQPPEWLGQDCLQSASESGKIYEACKLYRVATEELSAARIRDAISYTTLNQEALKKTLWWERITLDAGWIRPEYNPGPPVLGLVGAHVTLDIGEGRLGLFAGPGVMIVRLPNAFGGFDTKPSPDYGFSYRLKEFRVPGTHFSTRMSFTVVEVWIVGLVGNNLPTKANLTLVGLSFSPKRPRS